jgi:hypothetical protein
MVRQPNQLLNQFADWIPVELKAGENDIRLKVGLFRKIAHYYDGWGVKNSAREKQSVISGTQSSGPDLLAQIPYLSKAS